MNSIIVGGELYLEPDHKRQGVDSGTGRLSLCDLRSASSCEWNGLKPLALSRPRILVPLR